MSFGLGISFGRLCKQAQARADIQDDDEVTNDILDLLDDAGVPILKDRDISFDEKQ